MLTVHSFCGIPPRHQSLLSDSPIKVEGGWLAATALPCLHLVNGGELTPISAGREKLKRHSRSVSCYFPHRLFSPIFIWLFPPILILITCLYRQSPCLFMTHLYAPLKTDFIPTRLKQPLLHLPRTLQHENTLISPGFLRGACLLARSLARAHTHTCAQTHKARHVER